MDSKGSPLGPSGARIVWLKSSVVTSFVFPSITRATMMQRSPPGWQQSLNVAPTLQSEQVVYRSDLDAFCAKYAPLPNLGASYDAWHGCKCISRLNNSRIPNRKRKSFTFNKVLATWSQRLPLPAVDQCHATLYHQHGEVDSHGRASIRSGPHNHLLRCT